MKIPAVRAKLEARGRMLAQVRAFFEERRVLEVDTPILSQFASVALHIDPMMVRFQDGSQRYLHSSPEHGMKRLLVEGSGDIYQLSHVFREGEIGERHNPEFTLIEWYRVGLAYESLIDEVLELLWLFLPKQHVYTYTYQEAFEQFVGMNYQRASVGELQRVGEQYSLESDPSWDKETMLHFLMGFLIEPQLKGVCVLRDYPASQASLAQTFQREGAWLAKRFEVYCDGIELANGFQELLDPVEQRRRFEEENSSRVMRGKQPLPIDELFLKALSKGLPDCCGVAVGFDRLLLLQQQKSSIRDVLLFPWEEI